MQNSKLLFYGPVGDKSGKIIGGGESGNLKTISILKNAGFRVDILAKPYPKKAFLRHIYPIQLFLTYLRFFFKIKNYDSFHLSGFYNHLIYFELLFISTAKLFKVKSVYEIRAGGAIESYNFGSKLYKYCFKKTLILSTKVICQGENYIPFVKSISNVEARYYPNYILNNQYLPYRDEDRSKLATVNLVYFGRIAPSKNIEFIIDVCSNISVNFHCELIGGGDEDYITHLSNIISQKGLSEKITISPPSNSEKLFESLWYKHFFIFPSKEKREGHSNSLTEAMSRGVVPIVSNAGFNATVVKNEFLVIHDFSHLDYSDKIMNIINNKQWGQLSHQSYDLVGKYYTESNVRETLINVHS